MCDWSVGIAPAAGRAGDPEARQEFGLLDCDEKAKDGVRWLSIPLDSAKVSASGVLPALLSGRRDTYSMAVSRTIQTAGSLRSRGGARG